MEICFSSKFECWKGNEISPCMRRKKGSISIDWVLSVLLFFTLIMFSFFYLSCLFHLHSFFDQSDIESVWEKTKEDILSTNTTTEMYELFFSPNCSLPYIEYEPQKLLAYNGECDYTLLTYGYQSHYFSYHLFSVNNYTCLFHFPSTYYTSIFIPTYANDITLTSTSLSNSYIEVDYNESCITQVYYKGPHLNTSVCFNTLYEAKILPYGGVLNYDNETFIFLPSYSKTLIFISNITRNWEFILKEGYTHYYDHNTNSTISSSLFYSSTSPFFSLYNNTTSLTFYNNKMIDAYNISGNVKVIIKSTRDVYVHLDDGYLPSFYSCISEGVKMSYGRKEYVLNENEEIGEKSYHYNLTIPSLSKSWGDVLPSMGDVYSRELYVRVIVDNGSVYYTRGVLRVWRGAREE